MLPLLKRILIKLKIYTPKYLVMNGSHIDAMSSIGRHCYIGYNCFITKSNLGSYCSIANNVSIGPGEHAITGISTNSLFYENAYAQLTEKNVNIGHDVWIGVNAVIRRGVTIGNGAIIGANSFVNTDIPAYAVFAGTPAKLIKMRFNSEVIINIENSKWWLEPPAAAKIIISKIALT